MSKMYFLGIIVVLALAWFLFRNIFGIVNELCQWAVLLFILFKNKDFLLSLLGSGNKQGMEEK